MATLSQANGAVRPGAPERPSPPTPETWTPESHCGLAALSAGRYAGLRASEEQDRGVLITRPTRCQFGGHPVLAVNAIADRQSPIRVAILDAASGRPLAGYSAAAGHQGRRKQP